MRIRSVTAVPISFRVPQGQNVTLGIGRAVKRDSVLVKIETDEGVTGWGESHHGRCPGAIAKLVDTTISELVVGLDALDVVGVWSRVHRMQLASHGMGAAAAMALSGIDLALWDIRAKVAGWPLYRMLGGSSKPIKAYAGGISLGWQAPESLADEAQSYVEAGWRALKLRCGDLVSRDLARVRAVRERVGDEIDILVDANTNYSLDDARRAMPVFDELGIGWLEEPFSPLDDRAYETATSYGTVPLAAGENHFTRFDFTRLIDGGAVTVLQPDLSKTGGITEAMRIAAMGSAWKLTINPHTSATGVNMAATLNLLAAIDNPGYFEGDLAKHNPFRDEVGGLPYKLDADGCVRPSDKPGIGLEVDETFIKAHPLIDGPCYV
jgi:L-alanine-DL-glutamate epimerase-like enolase superfamily enzyme